MPFQTTFASRPTLNADLRLLGRFVGLRQGSGDKNATLALQRALKDAGYVSDRSVTGIFDPATENGLKLFQRYARIPETGVLDRDTLRRLARPRYDNFPDVLVPADVDLAKARRMVDSAAYVDNGVSWKKSDVRFSFRGFTPDLTAQQVQTVVRDAFAQWSDVTQMKFYEVPDADGVEIRISFADIDAPGGVLARTTWWYDGDTLQRAEVVFDEQETWAAIDRDVGGQPIELFIVAVHEIGHAIGFGHSSDAGAVMYAFYNPALDALAQDDINGATAKYGGDSGKNVVAETAVYAPGAAELGGRAFVAWAGTDPEHHLNVVASAKEGVYADKVTLGDTSPVGVSLCAFKDKLWLAWSGTGNRWLNLMSSPDGRSWGNKVTLGETSGARPSLAVHEGRLVLGWVGTDSAHHLNVLFSDDGAYWFGKRTLGDTSIDTPALASFLGRLFIAWTGTNSGRNLNVMSSGDLGASWQNKQVLGDTSIVGPSLLANGGQLLLGWAGTDSDHRLNVLSSADGVGFGQKRTLGDTSSYTPTLVRAYGAPAFAWTGRDAAQHLNLMTL